MPCPDCPDPMPIACTPSALTEDERREYAALLPLVTARASSVEETDEGFRFRYQDVDADLAGALARWALYEQRCCPFLTFSLSLCAGDIGRALTLLVVGPAEAKVTLGHAFAASV